MGNFRSFSVVSVFFTSILFSASLPSLAQDISVNPKKSFSPESARVADATRAAMPPDLNEWNGEMAARFNSSFDRKIAWVGNQVSDVIFDALGDISVVSTSLGGKDGRAQLKIGREVYDNHDILGSWTVADHIHVPLRLPLYTWNTSLGGNFGLYFQLGLTGGLELLNIRQVLPEAYWKLPTVADRKKEIEESPEYRSALEAPQPDPKPLPIKEDNSRVERKNEKEADEPWHAFDPLFKARYGRFWNMAIFPMRLPLKTTGLKRLENGEIISYLAAGGVELGGGIGWSLKDPIGALANLDATAFLRTYVRGSFRITILKENDRFVRVKVTRSKEQGHNIGFGNHEKFTVFEGFMVLGQDLNYRISVTPFSFSVDEADGNIFDVGYRYDLEDPAARDAYESAVLGRFAVSEELSEQEGKPVEKLFTRTSLFTRKMNDHSLGLYLVKKKLRSGVTCFDSVVTFPDGSTQVYRCFADNSKEWKFLWGFNEKIRNQFTLLLNKTQYGEGGADSFGMWIDGTLEDGYTTGSELLDYISDVETAIGKPNLFPRPPAFLPVNPPKVKPLRSPRGESQAENRPIRRPARYGRSSFYYRLTLDRPLLEKFIQTPEDKMWPILEQAFNMKPGTWDSPASRSSYRISHFGQTILNVPLFLANTNIRSGSVLWHADSIRKSWSAIKNISSPQEQSKALGDLFTDSQYSSELVKIVKFSLSGDEIGYNVSGKNSLFGRIYDQGRQIALDPVLERERTEIEFDNPENKRNQDSEATVEAIRIAAASPNQYELRFNLKFDPTYLYFKLSLSNERRFGAKTKTEIIEINAGGIFKQGQNTLVIDRTLTDNSLSARIGSKIVQGENYTLSIAMTRDGLLWGPVNSEEFKATVPQ